jgi:hypothetical protein
VATETKLKATKTYISHENAVKAAQKIYGHNAALRFFIMKTDDGRFFPVFIGQSAITAGVHFNFNVVG